MTAVFGRFSIFIKIYILLVLFQTNVGVMVFLRLIMKNSINISRRELIQCKTPSVFYLFTCLGLFRFYR